MFDLSKILQLVEAQKTIELAKAHYAHVQLRLDATLRDMDRLANLLNLKFETVEKLEAKSLINVFKSILKDKDGELEMERQEYLQVVLQYNEAKKTIALIEYEQEVLRKQIEQEDKINDQLTEAILLHRQEILAAYPTVAQKVIKLEKEISNLTKDNKEIIEALEVAKELEATLKVIITNLNRAAYWGKWEDMKLSQKIEFRSKNQFVDKALSQVYVAQLLFVKFEKELNDIHNHQRITGSYHFHDFGNFSEVYYNRLIADWVIQKRIKNSKQNVEGVSDSVHMISSSLSHESQKISSQIEALKNQIAYIIKTSVLNNED